MYIIIVGCGRVGSELARLLADSGNNVVVIDKDHHAFQKLGSDFNGLTVTGNGFDIDVLKEAGIEQANVFCTVTDNDNANSMSAQVAKKIFHLSKVITRINDSQYSDVYKKLEVDIVSGNTLLASLIRNKIVEGRLSSFFLENRHLAIMEIEATDKIVAKKVKDLNLPGELQIVAIRRKKEVFLVRPDDETEPDDILLAAVKTASLSKIKKFLGLK